MEEESQSPYDLRVRLVNGDYVTASSCWATVAESYESTTNLLA